MPDDREVLLKKGDVCEGIGVRCDFPDKTLVRTQDGEEAWVRYVLPGQRVRFRVTKKKGGKVSGNLLEVLEKAQEECGTGCCPEFGTCGGCFCLSLPAEAQIRLKEGQMRRLLLSAGLKPVSQDGAKAPSAEEPEKSSASETDRDSFGETRDDSGMDPGAESRVLFSGIKSSPDREGYRNKMELTFGDSCKNGPLTLGLHRRGSFYDIVPVDGCRIMHRDMRLAAACTLEHFRALGIPYYHRLKHTGILRHLLLRRSSTTGDLMAALVTAGTQEEEALLKLDELTEALKSLPLEGRLSGFLHMTNNSVADTVQSERTKILWGTDTIREQLFGLNFSITPFSFFQTNTEGAGLLYGIVRDYVGGEGNRLVFDLYSGTGTIAQILAPVSETVIGVELVGEAVRAARMNAAGNGLDNCSFLEGDVLRVLDGIREKPDVIVLDPPRDGIHPKALPKILSYEVPKIIYVSCKPTSFARDYPVFYAAGYRAVKACGADMFPGTAGTELVVCLEKDRQTPQKAQSAQP